MVLAILVTIISMTELVRFLFENSVKHEVLYTISAVLSFYGLLFSSPIALFCSTAENRRSPGDGSNFEGIRNVKNSDDVSQGKIPFDEFVSQKEDWEAGSFVEASLDR